MSQDPSHPGHLDQALEAHLSRDPPQLPLCFSRCHHEVYLPLRILVGLHHYSQPSFRLAQGRVQTLLYQGLLLGRRGHCMGQLYFMGGTRLHVPPGLGYACLLMFPKLHRIDSLSNVRILFPEIRFITLRQE